MPLLALHVPRLPLAEELKTVRLAQTFFRQTVLAEGQRVVLFSPRDTKQSCYFGAAMLGPISDVGFHDTGFAVTLFNVVLFAIPVTLNEIYAGHSVRPQFHAYSRSLHEVTDREALWLGENFGIGGGLAEEQAFFTPFTTSGEDKVRLASLRRQMLDNYGPACLFTGELMPSLDGERFGTQAGHYLPRRNGGPDLTGNCGPMTPNVNCYWDEGKIGLTNDFRILVAANADDEVRKIIAAGKLIRMPRNFDARPKIDYVEWHRKNVFGKGPCLR